jgi:hypothetical protein
MKGAMSALGHTMLRSSALGVGSRAGRRVDHAVQVRCGLLDVLVLVLPGAALGGQQAAAMRLLEVAVGELEALLGLFAGLVIDAEVPSGVGSPALVVDEAVLLVG